MCVCVCLPVRSVLALFFVHGLIMRLLVRLFQPQNVNRIVVSFTPSQCAPAAVQVVKDSLKSVHDLCYQAEAKGRAPLDLCQVFNEGGGEPGGSRNPTSDVTQTMGTSTTNKSSLKIYSSRLCSDDANHLDNIPKRPNKLMILT